MALFNYANREITAKVVYYGPGVCGKTTSLQYIHERIAPAQRGRLLSLATETDRTIFFDLLPLKLGEIGGFKLRFQLYTVPGQVKYNKTRKLVLQGADAIVFVADSQVNRQEANVTSLKNLEENLREQNRQVADLPLVYAYNKRDMENILSIEELNNDLNPKNLPHFPAIATQGVGVMETLEAISKVTLQDMEKRLTAGTSVEAEEDQAEELVMSGDGLLDLTSAEEELSFSTDELDSLQLESDLSLNVQENESLPSSPLETKPIGYDSDIPVEEIEIRAGDVAHTGTLKESEFFNLKDIEEQALRELDDFLSGKETEETFDFDLSEQPAEPLAAPEERAEFNGLTLSEESMEDQPAISDEESVLDFTLDSVLEEQEGPEIDMDEASSSAIILEPGEGLEFAVDEKIPQTEEEPELTLSFDEGDETKASIPDTEALELDTEELAPSIDDESPVFATDEDEFIGLNLDEEPFAEEVEEISAKGEIESLDLSESELDMALGEQKTDEVEELPAFTLDEEDAQGESTSLADDEDDLLTFSLDEESLKTTQEEIRKLEIDESSLGLAFGKDDAQLPESHDFRITDSVKFEMQVGEDISSGTPFEQQLDQLSEDIFSEEEKRPDEFQPEVSEPTEEEQFQIISDEWTRLMVLAKRFYHLGESYRAQHTVSENVLAVMLYYTAIETALKAVALKYETCNPAVASFHILLESIEEETGKTLAGAKSLRNNIVMMKNRIQLEAGYPDDEECELAERISERFLISLAEEFLTIDFTKLSPVLARSQKE